MADGWGLACLLLRLLLRLATAACSLTASYLLRCCLLVDCVSDQGAAGIDIGSNIRLTQARFYRSEGGGGEGTAARESAQLLRWKDAWVEQGRARRLRRISLNDDPPRWRHRCSSRWGFESLRFQWRLACLDRATRLCLMPRAVEAACLDFNPRPIVAAQSSPSIDSHHATRRLTPHPTNTPTTASQASPKRKPKLAS